MNICADELLSSKNSALSHSAEKKFNPSNNKWEEHGGINGRNFGRPKNMSVHEKCLQTECCSRDFHEEAVSRAYTALIIVLWIQ